MSKQPLQIKLNRLKDNMSLPACHIMQKASAAHVFGFYDEEGCRCEHLDKDGNVCSEEALKYKKFVDITNIRNLGGWAPLMGQIVACDRFAESTSVLCCARSYCDRPLHVREYYFGSFLRGSLEFISVGTIGLIIDCLVTSNRREKGDQSGGILQKSDAIALLQKPIVEHPTR